MKNLTVLATLTALAVTAPISAQDTEKPKMLSPGQIVEQAAPEEWKAIAASDLLVMELGPDAAGNERKVIIQLMPEPFSQGWVRNIRKLAKANWWDGTSINRVQDNYVVQWGDPAQTEEDRKPLPEGLEVMTESDYTTDRLFTREIANENRMAWQTMGYHFLKNALNAADVELIPPPGFEEALKKGDPKDIPEPVMPDVSDRYAQTASHLLGWPMGNNGEAETQRYWPIHCYGALGVGRGLSPDTGSGAELYTVIGHAPRHLDRNIAVVGRIVEGMHHLSSLPRGFGPLGFYETPEERVPIKSIRLASELSEVEQPRFEYLSTEGESFAKYANRRANREPPFFIKPAGGADICNIPVPVRRVKAEK